MKQRLLWAGLAVALVAIPVVAQDEPDTELGKKMETMDDAYKGFRRETDPVKGAQEARKAEEMALKALAEVPERLKKMPEGPEKAKAYAQYRKEVGTLFVTLCEVEEAFLNGKVDAVGPLVDKIKKLKKAGHDTFMEDEDE
jgi:hypothetical protein